MFKSQNSSFVKGLLIITTMFIVIAVASLTTAMAGNGMTWKKGSHDSTLGTDIVGCAQCDPYVGDTPCSSKLPILCIKQDGSEKPNDLVIDFYCGWASGHIGLTFPVRGDLLTSVNDANLICEYQFGEGYRMAEFHDGNGGWNWNAYGNIDDSTRFWVYNDQTSGNCW